MEAHQSKKIILAVDGSDAALSRILQYASSGQWREDQLILVAIVPRPVELFFYEPQWFGKTISPEEFQALKERLQQCCEQFVADGYRVSVELIHGDDPRGVKAAVMDLNPDLVVTPRVVRARNLLKLFRLSLHSFLVDALPCPVLVL